jgi:drug/metabolite transporter (DMT)-like permease
MVYLYIAATIALTCYGQLVIRWRIPLHGDMPTGLLPRLLFLLSLYLDPFVLSGFIGAVVSGLFWMAALTKLPLSHAYPFMALSFAIVLFGSAVLFQEPLTWPKILGVTLIIAGIIVGSQG